MTWKVRELYLDAYAVAVKDTFEYVGTKFGVYRSSTNGNSWKPAESKITDNDIRTLAVAGDTLYSGSDGGGVFLSTDDGVSWTGCSDGLTGAYINSLSVSGTTCFAATKNGGVFRTIDDGDSWTTVNVGLPRNDILSVAAQGNTVIAGFDISNREHFRPK